MPELGAMLESSGVPTARVTLKASVREAVSVPVVTVTVRKPAVAPEAMAISAVRLVLLETVTVPTVIPAPKEGWLWPWVKLVLAPVIVTKRFDWPCCPVAGLTLLSVGVAGLTGSTGAAGKRIFQLEATPKSGQPGRTLVWISEAGWRPTRLQVTDSAGKALADMTVSAFKTNSGLTAAALRQLPKDAQVIRQ